MRGAMGGGEVGCGTGYNSMMYCFFSVRTKNRNSRSSHTGALANDDVYELMSIKTSLLLWVPSERDEGILLVFLGVARLELRDMCGKETIR